MKHRKLKLPMELQYCNRNKWGFVAGDNPPLVLQQTLPPVAPLAEIYNFCGYTFSEN
ncbi:hypothetical protein [Rufibacter sp. DG15C]|jgi:hypothetical protein|uniref:hypothetical protein n=1 Tax=Rufibacter sp. DG15C TaxID=1379909 RepID=UPI000A58FB34|nr:hypothetical protein [Rufibacter sp. DG15C]